MGDKSKIEWTEATWNPTVGCSVISPGCTNCYAMKMAARLEAMATADRPRWTPAHRNGQMLAHYVGTTKRVNGNAVWTGKLALAPEHILTAPLRWKRSRKIFVNSMSDLFHESVPDEWIDQVFAVMALASQHTFQVLTKRAERMRVYCNDEQTPFRIARAIDAIGSVHHLGAEDVRPIAGYDGYFVSSHGHVYSEKRGSRRRLKPDVGDQGHMRVPLYASGDKSYDRLLVHRLVLETFVGPSPAPDTQGRHRDGDPTNNAVSNLVWGDQQANWADSRRHGTHRRYSKLTEDQVSEIRRRHASGESGEALAREFPVSATQIRNIASGVQWAIEVPIEWPLSQIWLGVSAEDQKRADERIPHLLDTPAAVRFVSAEPLIGQIDFENIIYPKFKRQHEYDPYIAQDALRGHMKGPDDIGLPRLDWIIVGGESGPNARPMHPDWARSIRDQCQAAGVPYFFKQWGEWGEAGTGSHWVSKNGGRRPVGNGVWAGDVRMSKVGKRKALRLLDGCEHNEMPKRANG